MYFWCSQENACFPYGGAQRTVTVESQHWCYSNYSLKLKVVPPNSIMSYLQPVKLIFRCQRPRLKSMRKGKTKMKPFLTLPCVLCTNRTGNGSWRKMKTLRWEWTLLEHQLYVLFRTLVTIKIRRASVCLHFLIKHMILPHLRLLIRFYRTKVKFIYC